MDTRAVGLLPAAAWPLHYHTKGKTVNIEDYMTVQQVASEFGREESVVRRACINGWIDAVKFGKQWMIQRKDADERWGKKDPA